jgi:hypothetical protein
MDFRHDMPAVSELGTSTISDVQTGTVEEEDQSSKYDGWDQAVSSPLTVLQAPFGQDRTTTTDHKRYDDSYSGA